MSGKFYISFSFFIGKGSLTTLSTLTKGVKPLILLGFCR